LFLITHEFCGGAGLAESARRGKMVMYSLTARGAALLDAVSADVAV
jgi:hypothetical protein